LALKGEHQCVTVDDSGRGREQGGDATQRWFELLRLWGAEPLEIVDTVYPGGVGNSLETREFGLLCGDDQLADLGMRNPVLATIRVEALSPGDTAAPSDCPPGSTARHE